MDAQTTLQTFSQALSWFEQGQDDKALAAFNARIEADANDWQSLMMLGMIAGKRNKPALAIEFFDRTLALQPGRSDALSNRASALILLNRHAEALTSLDKLVLMVPGNANAWGNKGIALQALARLPEAVECFSQALRLAPDNLDFLYRYGTTTVLLKQYDEACQCLQRLVKLAPTNTLALHALATALRGLNMLDAALGYFDRASAINPMQIETRHACGNLLLSMARNQEAVLSYDAAIGVDATVPEIHHNRGIALKGLRRDSEALAAYEVALSLRSDYPDAHLNRGTTLSNLNRIDEALASFELALNISPQQTDAAFNQGLCHLLQGDFARGFQKYEHRWMQDGVVKVAAAHAKPLWLGMSDIEGKTILLHAEQGFGDTIQFCRYAKQIAALGARVVMQVPRSLLPLLDGLAGVDVLSDQLSKLPPVDFQCPMLSLPLACKTQLADLNGSPYLQAPTRYIDAWAKRLGERKRPRIGVMWSGSSVHPNDKNRSIPFAQFGQLISPELDFFSLQNLTRETDLALLGQTGNLARFDQALKNFADTAALISLMDLVISVDTSVAHLAAALGKPVWILLPFCPDWRWMLSRTDTPWYDSAILFRQPQIGQWDSVLNEIKERLLTL